MIEQKILDILREALPEKEIGIVKTVFEDREKFAREIESNKLTIKSLNEQIEALQKETSRQSSELAAWNAKEIGLNKREESLNNRDESISEREVQLEKTIAQKESEILRDCLDKVLKVPTVRKEIQTKIPVTSYNYDGKPQSTYIQNETNAETTKEE